MKVQKKSWIIGIILISVGVIGILFAWRLQEQDGQNIRSQTFDARKVEEISVHLNVSDIEIKQSKDALIKVEWKEDEKAPVQVKMEKRKLMVQGKHDVKKWLNLERNKSDIPLRLYLPAKEFQAIHLQNNVGDISANTIVTKDLSIISTTGDMKIKNGTTEKFSVRLLVGDIEVVDTTGEGQLETKTGDITYEGTTITQPMLCTTEVGDITMRLKEKPKDVSFIVETNVGSVDVFQEKGNIHTSGAISVYTRTKTGDITITDK